MENKEKEIFESEHEVGKSVSKTKEYTIIGILALALLGSLGYNLYQNNQKQKNQNEIQVLTTSVEDIGQQKANLEGELNTLNEEYEQIKLNLDEKNELLTQKDEEISAKQKEIQHILNKSNVTQKELDQAKQLIASLNRDISGYKAEIAELRIKNDSLTQENTTLLTQQTVLSDDLSAAVKKNEETESMMRSTFTLSNFEVKSVKTKDSGKEVERDKAKRVDKLKVDFDLNPAANQTPGEANIYISIFKPDGTIGKFQNSNPGTLDTWNLGTVDYSDMVNFTHNGTQSKHISFDWEDYEFQPGEYKFDIYQNGLRIGQKSIVLK
ncbi:MAG: hypothetical protein WDA08_01465 [Weeksellaceae bacterium]